MFAFLSRASNCRDPMCHCIECTSEARVVTAWLSEVLVPLSVANRDDQTLALMTRLMCLCCVKVLM